MLLISGYIFGIDFWLNHTVGREQMHFSNLLKFIEICVLILFVLLLLFVLEKKVDSGFVGCNTISVFLLSQDFNLVP